MNFKKDLRKYSTLIHKWLRLVIGIQVLSFRFKKREFGLGYERKV